RARSERDVFEDNASARSLPVQRQIDFTRVVEEREELVDGVLVLVQTAQTQRPVARVAGGAARGDRAVAVATGTDRVAGQEVAACRDVQIAALDVGLHLAVVR